MAGNGSYAGERPLSSAGDVEYASDPASGGFFATDFRKHDDLKNMLDGNKDGLKLEAMKRIIGMVAKGKDASDLFPAVVKNVVSKNIEVKKLVYVYLVRYAEEQQDLALLSISTFQRALKDPNQLIRASALRVLSSIRVPVIVPIMMLSIKDSANDMSPYVRKTAAHAIPKLYSLDPEQRDQLIEVIEKLLSDKTTLVVGSAVMAFEEVCPERIDLIHKNYRKLCNLLVDVEEWGQVIIIHMLTRYSRTQFTDPNKIAGYHESQDDKHFYDSDGSHEKDVDEPKPYVMDPDHRLLLRNCKPLLQSRNAAVVMAVARLYYYVAPRNEVTFIAKALIRLLHNHREVQSVVLSNIATISTKNKGIFEPYLKNFFVRSSDPTHIKLLKLEVLTNLATETNISIILREFQTYVCSSDMEFVAATIQAIGRCASTINEVTDTCLNGLVLLLSNRNETVVGESVVVIKKLLQMQPSDYKSIIVHMAKLVDSIAVPMARASILWLLGEYADRVPKIAPDVLRKMAKTFINEEDIVKLQTLNLASKLYLTNTKQTKLLAPYVFSLAKYDQNYDIRDRARFLKQLIMPQGESTTLSKYAKKILLANKPAPILQSKFKDRDQFQLGSLSHFINSQANGYQELPDFPEIAPDPSVRNVEITMPWQEARPTKKKKQLVKKSSFYSETESSGPAHSENSDSSEENTEESGDSSQEGSSSEDGSSESEMESEDSSEDSDASDKDSHRKKSTKIPKKPAKPKPSESSSSDDEPTSSGSSNEDSESSKDDRNANRRVHVSKPTSNLDLLLDLETDATQAPVLQAMTVSSVPITAFVDNQVKSNVLHLAHPAYIPHQEHELLNRFTGNGLIATYRFTRGVNIFSPKMTTIELVFRNEGSDDIKGVSVLDRKMGNIDIKGFPTLASLAVNSTAMATIGIDYNESTNPATLELKSEKQTFKVTIKAPVGEIFQPVLMSEDEFSSHQNKLKGMNECISQVELPSENTGSKVLMAKVYEVANVMQVSSTQENANVLRFAGQTLTSKSLVLLTLQTLNSGKISISVNCEKIVLATVLMRELKEHFSK